MKRLVYQPRRASAKLPGDASAQSVLDMAAHAVATIDAISLDMVDIKETIRRHDKSESHARMVLEHAPVAIITTSDEGTIESANQAAQRLFGYKAEEMLGRNLSFLIPGEGDRRNRPDRDQVIAGPWLTMRSAREAVARRCDGKSFAIEVLMSQARLGTRTISIAIVRDVST